MDITKLTKSILARFPKSVQTKFKKICNAGIDGPLKTKGVCVHSSRISIPYNIICSFPLSQLQTYVNGMVVSLPYNKYEQIRDNPERNELDDYLINNIGGNENLSSYICIMTENGFSGSKDCLDQFKRFEIEKNIKDWKKIARIDKNYSHKGNDKWTGHYYYSIKGGTKNNTQSHPGKHQIFTTYKGFIANKKVIDDVIASLLYQFLHCYDILDVIKADELAKYKLELEQYLKNTYYMGKSCYELINKLDIIKDGILMSAIRCHSLSIKMFANEKELDISHYEAVSKKKIYFCETNNILLSDYRPGNVFWDTHIGNMQQQDFTIDEYWVDHHKRTLLYNSLFK